MTRDEKCLTKEDAQLLKSVDLIKFDFLRKCGMDLEKCKEYEKKAKEECSCSA